MPSERIVCETPTPGRKPTRIERWKYESVRQAILEVLAQHPDGVPFRELATRVGERLGTETRDKLGSLGWYTTTVKLDLEVKGEIRQVEGVKPQRLVRGPA